MKKLLLPVALLGCIASFAAAEQKSVLEPGQAEAVTTESAVLVPSEWEHPKIEARGVWFTAEQFLVPKEELVSRLDRLKSANFNAVFLNVWFRGYVVYPGSKLIPQYEKATQMESGDPLKTAIEEAKKRGFKVYAWPEYGFYAYHTKDASTTASRGPILDKHPELTAVSSTGDLFIHNKDFGDFYSMCPSNPDSHKILSVIYTETLDKYDFDGLNLDRIRYPAENYCYCSYCKTHFKGDTGLELTANIDETTGAKTFLDWKRERTADAVKLITQTVRKTHPKTTINAYVVGPDEMNDKAQSWDLWMKRGYLDAIAVSMYGSDARPVIEKAHALLGDKKDKLIAAINAGLPTTDLLLRNIGFVRKQVPLGQIVWYAGNVDDDLAKLKTGPYAEPAEWPELKK